MLDDLLGSLRAVYATFKAVSGYDGAAGQMVRAFDGAAQDLQFLCDGEADEAQIATFAAGGTVQFLPYDQSGNGLHAAQPAASRRPLLCEAGTVCRNANGKVAAKFVAANRHHWLVPDLFPAGTAIACVLAAGEMGADGNRQLVTQYRGPVVALDIELNEFGKDGQTQLSQSGVDIQANQTFEITYPQAVAAHYTNGGAAHLLVGGVDHGTDATCAFAPSGTIRTVGADGTATLNGTMRLVCASADPDRTKLLAVARWLNEKASTTQYDPASLGEQVIQDVSTFVGENNNHANWMSFQHPIDSWLAGDGTSYQAAGWWDKDLKFAFGLRSRPPGGGWTGFTVYRFTMSNPGSGTPADVYHNSPRLGFDKLGRLWVFDGRHGTAMHAYRTGAPVNAWDGTTMAEVMASAWGSAYAGSAGYATPFHLPDGNMAVLWLSGGVGNGRLILFTHDPDADTWGPAGGLDANGVLFDGTADSPDGTVNAYHHQKPVTDAAGNVHFVGWVRTTFGSANERDLWHVKWNPAAGTWSKKDGTTQTVPVTDNNKVTVKSFGGATTNVGATAAACDAVGSCLFVFSASDDADGLRVLEVTTSGAVHERLLPYAILKGRRAAFVSGGRLHVVASLADKGQGIRLFRSGVNDYTTWAAATLTKDFIGMATPTLDVLLQKATGEVHLVTPVRPLNTSQSAGGFPAVVCELDPAGYSFA